MEKREYLELVFSGDVCTAVGRPVAGNHDDEKQNKINNLQAEGWEEVRDGVFVHPEHGGVEFRVWVTKDLLSNNPCLTGYFYLTETK